jgi:squalene-hopene/tetraprenyl-beta-curcumene cyclase
MLTVEKGGCLSASLAVERGMRFVLAKQGRDGLWRDFLTPAGEASEWLTGVIATALQIAAAEAGALDRAAEGLVLRQHADGGWGYNEDVPSDADSTACALLFLAGTDRCADVCRRAASCLVTHQRESGGIATYREPGPIRDFMGVGRWWRFNGWCRPHTDVTATAGRALAAVASNDLSQPARDAWRYVRSKQRRDGSWSSYWWISPHYATLEAVELASSLGDHEPVAHAAEWVLRSQEADGAWNATGAFATALSLSVLARARAGRRSLDRAIARLVALQDADGGWPSEPIMRIPLPGDTDPDKPRLVSLGRGMIFRDQHRTFTSAACIAALARAETH